MMRDRTAPTTDADAAAAYRELPQRRRWRVARLAGRGETADSIHDAAAVAWYARRALRRQPWEVVATMVGIAVLAALLLQTGRQAGVVPFAMWVVIAPVFSAFLHRPRLRRAAVDNARWVASATETPQPEPAGRTTPSGVGLVLGITAALTLAGFASTLIR